MTDKIIPVIMAGGKGTRLWPLSRATAPKQFIQFVGDKTLFQETLNRVSDQAQPKPIVITNEEFRFLVAEQARVAVPLAGMLLEPVARNTAAAVAAAATLASSARTPSSRSPRSRDRRRRDLFRLHPHRPRCRSRRQARDLRHHADRAGDGLRLYRDRRCAQKRCPQGQALRRKAGTRKGRADARRRRLLLELRHLHVPGGGTRCRTAGICA